MIYILAILCIVMVILNFIAFREGVRTGLSLSRNRPKLPPLSKKCREEEKQTSILEQKAEQEEKNTEIVKQRVEQEKELNVMATLKEIKKFEEEQTKGLEDINEALDLGRLEVNDGN